MKQANRKNEGKPKYSLLHLPSLEGCVKVLEFGEKKYARDDWKAGFPVTELCDSLVRHLASFLDGEDLDKESGLEHIGHMQCNLMFLAHTIKHHKNLDNRKQN